jgi:hypothetical protein
MERWNVEKNLFFHLWNVEKVPQKRVECGERTVECGERFRGKRWNGEKNGSAPKLFKFYISLGLQASYEFNLSPYSTVCPKWFPT